MSSSTQRLVQVADLMNNACFVAPLQFDSNSLYLDFKCDYYKWKQKPTLIYHNETTHTWVYAQSNLIVKVYYIRDGNRFNIEIRYLRIFAEFVLQEICPHFVLPIGRAIIDKKQYTMMTDDLAKTLPDDASFQVILSERADYSLWDFAHQCTITPYMWKVILFQIFYTLFVLSKNFPSFRHNDLHIGNILIQNITPSPHSVKYHIDIGLEFYHDIRLCPHRILLWDMYFASINKKDTKSVRATATPDRAINPYYDVHKLLDSIDYLFKKRKVNQQLKAFMEYALPDQYKCRSRI